MSGFKRSVQEVHRRSLWQVLGIYLAGSWMALQVVDVLANTFALPQWFPRFALALLVIGLPVVLATAFIQEGLARNRRTGAEATPDSSLPATEDGVGHRQLFTWRNAIGGGVAAFGLWGVVATAWLLFGPSAGGAPNPVSEPTAARSIAVLPFASVHTDEESRSFTSGIHDDILTQLSKIGSIKVISRTSVMQYEGTKKTIGQIAEELGVETVVEGSVQRAGDRVRVTALLIDAATDEHLWAETYDDRLTAANIFAMQSALARDIVGALRANLAPGVAAEIDKRPTESLEAYDLYTRGRYLVNTRGLLKEGLEAAVRLFDQAIAEDPGYAMAHAALADAYLSLWIYGYEKEGDALPLAREAVERALELDPTLAEAHASLGYLLEAELRFDAAARAYRRALELNPGSAPVRYLYGALLISLGRHQEAIVERRRALELDPLSIRYRIGLLTALFFARDYAGTIAEAEKLAEIDPANPDAYYWFGMAYGMTDQHAAAVAAASKATELNPEDPYYPAGLALAHARAGQRAQALEALAQAQDLGAPLKEIALIYGALGDVDEAFAYLDRAFAEEPGSLGHMNVDPTADPLRSDPRWGELIKKIGLE